MPQDVDVDDFMQQRRQPTSGADVNAATLAAPANAAVAPDDIDTFMLARRQHEAVIRTAPVPPPELAVAHAQLKGQVAAEVTAAQAHDLLQSAGQRMIESVRAQIPHELRGFTPDELSGPGGFINPRTGQQSTVAGDLEAAGQPQGNAPTLNDLVTGPIQGIANIHEGLAQATRPSPRDKAAGDSRVIGGALQVASPTLPGAAAAAPVATALGLGIGTAAQTGTEAGLKAAGVPEEYAKLAGDVAGLGTGIAAGHGIGRFKGRGAAVAEEVPTRAAETAPPKRQAEELSTQTIETPVQPEVQRGTSSPDVDAFMAARKAGQPDVDAFMASRAEPTPVEPKQPAAPEPEPAPQQATTAVRDRTGTEAARNQEALRSPARQPAFRFPASPTVYPAKYALRDLADVRAPAQRHKLRAEPRIRAHERAELFEARECRARRTPGRSLRSLLPTDRQSGCRERPANRRRAGQRAGRQLIER